MSIAYIGRVISTIKRNAVKNWHLSIYNCLQPRNVKCILLFSMIDRYSNNTHAQPKPTWHYSMNVIKYLIRQWLSYNLFLHARSHKKWIGVMIVTSGICQALFASNANLCHFYDFPYPLTLAQSFLWFSLPANPSTVIFMIFLTR